MRLSSEASEQAVPYTCIEWDLSVIPCRVAMVYAALLPAFLTHKLLSCLSIHGAKLSRGKIETSFQR